MPRRSREQQNAVAMNMTRVNAAFESHDGGELTITTCHNGRC